MKILHTIAGVGEKTGGPAASVPALCLGLARLGHEVTLLTGSGNLAPALRGAEREIRVRTVLLGPAFLGHASPAFRKACRLEAQQSDLLHTHGLWLMPNRDSVNVAKAAGLPWVVSPRGMLSSWALARSRTRKGLAWSWFQRRALAHAALVHVTSPAERAELRRVGIDSPAALVPNGCYLEPLRDPDAARAEPPVVLFLSRLHAVKGLDLLVKAWSGLGLAHRAKLVIAGSGRADAVRAVRADVERFAAPNVELVGWVGGAEKARLLQEATVVVLPSYSENYGMVVAEALASGTPVITTTGTPWQSVVNERCGWWVEPEVETLTGALEEALSLEPAELLEMGCRGRGLIERDHSIESAARKMADAYAWACGRGPRPAIVSLPSEET